MLFPQLTQVLDPEPHDAAMNMAIDESLLEYVREPLVRIYQWARPAVSFGYFGKYDQVASEWQGREVVRRMTGGGIVPHGEDITYTLVVPASHAFAQLNARESYRSIHAALAMWLAARGFQPTLAGAQPQRVGGACFANASEADILEGARKLAGAAQRRTRMGLLYQGSIQGVSCAWRDELPGALAGEISVREFSGTETAGASQLARAKYGTDAWNGRIR